LFSFISRSNCFDILILILFNSQHVETILLFIIFQNATMAAAALALPTDGRLSDVVVSLLFVMVEFVLCF